jgi:Holliday junction resolvase RusA-like endonuclease
MEYEYHFKIEGNPVSSKNEYGSAFNKKGTPFLYTRKDIKTYNRKAKFQLEAQKHKYIDRLPLSDKLWVAFLFYPENYRRDFLNLLSAPADLLQKSGIITNDRNIRLIDGSKIVELDKENPRIEIIIKLLPET